MRFNRDGRFNVPFCHKEKRFSQAYITKIVNQISSVSGIISNSEWVFEVADFRKTLSNLKQSDIVYADPPYAGRYVDYFNSWFQEDENCLAATLKSLPCNFILSTWHSNKFRENPLILENWRSSRFHVFTRQHFYHVGSTQNLRHPLVEALITNFTPLSLVLDEASSEQLSLLEQPASY